MPDPTELLRIAHRRMNSALLWADQRLEPENVVGWFAAMQAQDYERAKWAVAMRVVEGRNADLDRAVDDGRILRTHALRPTWHFVLPEDIVWIQGLTGPRVHVLNRHYYRRLGLDDSLRESCERLISGWLENEGHLSRNDIGQRLQTEGIDASGERLAYILMSAELNGVVCSGRRRGATHTYALVRERVGSALHLSEDQALVELTLRYFRSHGPATARDMRWWSSLTLGQIRRGLELAGDRLIREQFGDLELWSASLSLEETRRDPPVHLLQPYDEYTVAFSETKGTVDVDGIDVGPHAVDGRAFYSPVLFDGQLTGWWRRALRRWHLEVEVRLSRRSSERVMHGIRAAADAYGRFHDLPVEVVVWPRHES